MGWFVVIHICSYKLQLCRWPLEKTNPPLVITHSTRRSTFAASLPALAASILQLATRRCTEAESSLVRHIICPRCSRLSCILILSCHGAWFYSHQHDHLKNLVLLIEQFMMYMFTWNWDIIPPIATGSSSYHHVESYLVDNIFYECLPDIPISVTSNYSNI